MGHPTLRLEELAAAGERFYLARERCAELHDAVHAAQREREEASSAYYAARRAARKAIVR